MQKLQPLKTLLLLLVITLLAAFLAACSTESSSTTPVSPDAPDTPNPVAGEMAFTLNLDKLVIDRAQVTAHFTNALLKTDLEKKGNYSGTASISSIATGGEFTTNGNTYASNVTLTLSGELEAHSLVLAGKITAYPNLRSSNVVDLASFHRIPLPSSSSNYKGILLLSLDSEEFAGRQVFFNSGVGDLADLAFSNTPYNGGTAYLLPGSVELQVLTNKISLAVQVKKGSSVLREERKLYQVNSMESSTGAIINGAPVFTHYSKANEDITITYLYKIEKSVIDRYNYSIFGEYDTSFTKDYLSFYKNRVDTNFSGSRFAESFSSFTAETPKNENPGNSTDFLYRNTFTLKDYKTSAPDTGDIVKVGLDFGVLTGKSGAINLRFNRKP